MSLRRRVVVGEKLYGGVFSQLVYPLLEQSLGLCRVEFGLGRPHRLAEGLLARTGYAEGDQPGAEAEPFFRIWFTRASLS